MRGEASAARAIPKAAAAVASVRPGQGVAVLRGRHVGRGGERALAGRLPLAARGRGGARWRGSIRCRPQPGWMGLVWGGWCGGAWRASLPPHLPGGSRRVWAQVGAPPPLIPRMVWPGRRASLDGQGGGPPEPWPWQHRAPPRGTTLTHQPLLPEWGASAIAPCRPAPLTLWRGRPRRRPQLGTGPLLLSDRVGRGTTSGMGAAFCSLPFCTGAHLPHFFLLLFNCTTPRLARRAKKKEKKNEGADTGNGKKRSPRRGSKRVIQDERGGGEGGRQRPAEPRSCPVWERGLAPPEGRAAVTPPGLAASSQKGAGEVSSCGGPRFDLHARTERGAAAAEGDEGSRRASKAGPRGEESGAGKNGNEVEGKRENTRQQPRSREWRGQWSPPPPRSGPAAPGPANHDRPVRRKRHSCSGDERLAHPPRPSTWPPHRASPTPSRPFPMPVPMICPVMKLWVAHTNRHTARGHRQLSKGWVSHSGARWAPPPRKTPLWGGTRGSTQTGGDGNHPNPETAGQRHARLIPHHPPAVSTYLLNG